MSRIQRKYVILVLVNVAALLQLLSFSSCYEDCDAKSEPSIFVGFDPFRAYDTVYGVKDKFEPLNRTSSNGYDMPVDIGNDITTYVFKNDSVTDTLAVTYIFDVQLESPECGFTGKLSDLAIHHSTTFEFVEIVASDYIEIK